MIPIPHPRHKKTFNKLFNSLAEDTALDFREALSDSIEILCEEGVSFEQFIYILTEGADELTSTFTNQLRISAAADMDLTGEHSELLIKAQICYLAAYQLVAEPHHKDRISAEYRELSKLMEAVYGTEAVKQSMPSLTS